MEWLDGEQFPVGHGMIPVFCRSGRMTRKPSPRTQSDDFERGFPTEDSERERVMIAEHRLRQQTFKVKMKAINMQKIAQNFA